VVTVNTVPACTEMAMVGRRPFGLFTRITRMSERPQFGMTGSSAFRKRNGLHSSSESLTTYLKMAIRVCKRTMRSSFYGSRARRASATDGGNLSAALCVTLGGDARNRSFATERRRCS
jgi:hypothetical protein